MTHGRISVASRNNTGNTLLTLSTSCFHHSGTLTGGAAPLSPMAREKGDLAKPQVALRLPLGCGDATYSHILLAEAMPEGEDVMGGPLIEDGEQPGGTMLQ